MSPDPVTVAAVGGAAVAWAPLGKTFLEALLKPSLEEIGEEGRRRFAAYFAKNREAIGEKAAKRVADSGKAVVDVPMATTIALIEGAQRVDDPSLQDMWAGLIASAMTAESTDEVPPQFADALSQLTPLAAQYLDMLDQLADEITERVPKPGELSRFGATGEEVAQRMGIAYDFRVWFVEDLLLRQVLIEREPVVRSDGGAPAYTSALDWRLTTLGWRLLYACRGKKNRAA